ncbi:I78 family peptidase inhibitor [Altererythrobacter sp. Z27]|uniref:I78 family peptidase inhibitor n=1 Tax=Altererythrobacter sp. Z27 TaxID=3461147 RepID=UPI004044B562
MRELLSPILVVSLAACGNYGGTDFPPAPPTGGSVCDAAPAQYHIGQEANSATGAAILRDSGAKTLRWGPPNSAWTMDYREDRVNARYDDAMKITEITCG